MASSVTPILITAGWRRREKGGDREGGGSDGSERGGGRGCGV